MPVKYSIIIPVYNSRQYLDDCTAGILAIPERDIEILLIDDGSTDGSAELCDQLVRKDSRVRALHQANRGVSEARNRGIQEAAGEMLLFFDADDTVSTESLQKMLFQTIPGCPSDLFIFGMSFDTYHHGLLHNQNTLLPPFSGTKDREELDKFLLQLFYANSLSSLCNKVFFRELLESHQLWLKSDMIQFEDLDFMLRYLAVCRRVSFVQECIYHYRQSETVDKARNRLQRIPDLSAVVSVIKASLEALCSSSEAFDQAKEIVISIYSLLAGEKVHYESVSGIRKICRDFSAWKQANHVSLGKDDPKVLRMMERNAVFSIWIRARLSGLAGRLRGLRRVLSRRKVSLD